MEIVAKIIGSAASLGGPAIIVAATIFVAWLAWLRFGARIYAREKSFEMRLPFTMGGRPDLIMQEWGGKLVIHDLKTRKGARVYDSDKLQLALYALLVAKATGRSVAAWAVVRVQVPGQRPRLLKVPLDIPLAELESLRERFAAAAISPLAARMTAAPHLCKLCGFRSKQCPGR